MSTDIIQAGPIIGTLTLLSDYPEIVFGGAGQLRTSDLLLVSSKLGHSSTVQTEKYTKFEESELIKDFPIQAVRLCDEGQVLKDSYQSEYNYGKA